MKEKGKETLPIPGVLCRHETREVDVPLTPEEWAARSEEMALTLERVRLHEEYASQVRKFLAAEKEKINAELQKLGAAVTRHAEPREIPVAIFVDAATGRTLAVLDVDETTNPPTGIVHSVRAATPEDLDAASRVRQLPLGLAGQQGQGPHLRVVPSVGAPPMPDLGGATGAAAGERVIVLMSYDGSNQIRATAALANAFKLPVTECRKLLHALSLGVPVVGGRLSGAQLTMGADQLRLADFKIEVEEDDGMPEVEVEVELTAVDDEADADGVVRTLVLILGIDELTAQRLVTGAPAVITRMPSAKATELVAMLRARKAQAWVVDGAARAMDGQAATDDRDPEGATLPVGDGYVVARDGSYLSVSRTWAGLGAAEFFLARSEADDAARVWGGAVVAAESTGNAIIADLPDEPISPAPWRVDAGPVDDEPATADEVKQVLEENTDPEGWGWVTVNDCGDGKMGSATTALRDLGFARAPARALLDKIAASSEPVVVYVNRGMLADFPLSFGDGSTYRTGKVSIHEVAENLRAAGLAATAVQATAKRRR